MKPLFDLHTHTTASGHAFSSLKENIQEAAQKGLAVLGTSDHAPAMPGTTHPIFFTNYKAIPDELMGVHILCGIEANIVDGQGQIDVEESMCGKLDYIIASLHTPCIRSGSREENTRAITGAMKNPYVKIIGHPDDDRYPLDYELLTDAAREYGVALELNNSSFRPTSGRQNASVNARILLEKCREKQVPVILGSDAHIYCDIGRFDEACAMLAQCGFPEELVLNSRLEGLKQVLNRIPEWLMD